MAKLDFDSRRDIRNDVASWTEEALASGVPEDEVWDHVRGRLRAKYKAIPWMILLPFLLEFVAWIIRQWKNKRGDDVE